MLPIAPADPETNKPTTSSHSARKWVDVLLVDHAQRLKAPLPVPVHHRLDIRVERAVHCRRGALVLWARHAAPQEAREDRADGGRVLHLFARACAGEHGDRVERERAFVDERHPVLGLAHERDVVVRHGQQPREELRKRPRRRVRDAPAQDLAVRVRIGDPPERVERCVEVRRGVSRERERGLDRGRIAVVAVHDCGNEQRVEALDRPWWITREVQLRTCISDE